MAKKSHPQRPPSNARKAPNPIAPAPGRTPRWLIGGVLVLAMAGLTFFFCEQFLFAKIPGELAGLWEIQGGDQDEGRLEFSRNGRFKAVLKLNGREAVIDGTCDVDGKSLRITTENPNTRKPETQVQTIQQLTRHELVLVDAKKKVFKLRRLE